MSTGREQITVDTAFELLPKKETKDFQWTVTLGDPEWQKDILMLALYEEDDEGEMSWARYGRVDALQRSVSNPTRSLLLMTSWSESVDVWDLDPKKFSGHGALCHVQRDIDGVISKLRSASLAKDWTVVLDIIVSYIQARQANGLTSAMRRVRKDLREAYPDRFVGSSQASGSQPLPSVPIVPLGKRKAPESAGGSGGDKSRSTGSGPPIPKKPRSGTPSAAGASNVVQPKKKKVTKPAEPRLENVPTHLDKTKSESKADRIQYQEDLLARCAIQPDTITVDIGSLYAPVRDKATALPPYQVRHIQPYFLEQLTKRMSIFGASFLATPFVLLVDPEMCSTREEFDLARKNEYRYYVIGGNHSACAKADLSVTNSQFGAYRRVAAWIFAGLSVTEARNLAWGHNIDNEFRATMSTIQRVNYIHLRYMENGGESNPEFKKECAMEIQLKDWGIRKDAEVLNANDNLFQISFRKDPIWSYITRIFDKWELCEVKGQKVKDVKKPKTKEGSIEAKAPFDDMKLTEWKLMQPIKDPEVVIPVLQRVLDKELSLPEMGQEFKRLKYMGVVQRAFISSLVEPSWSACKSKYKEHCTDEILKNFVPVFTSWKEKAPSKKKKGEQGEEETMISYPDKFSHHICQAQAWLAMVNSNQQVSQEDSVNLRCSRFEHPKFGDILYEIHCRDARLLHDYVPKREYTLLLADIPYGFAVPGCMHDDTIAWGHGEISAMLRAFKVVTTARLWRVILIHSLDQHHVVKAVLEQECNGGIQSCVWIKENVKNAGGARLNSNFECFSIGFHSSDGVRTMDHFNFRGDESRNNVVKFPAVTSKLKHSGDNKAVNVYQKPRDLLNWMVGHFSLPGNWVMDLCAGSGTGLVSSLSLGRHCVAVEEDSRQADVLKGRVLRLDEYLEGEGEVVGEIVTQGTDAGVAGPAAVDANLSSIGLDSQTAE